MSLPYRATILGCGSSTGVPRVGGDWGACDPGNPRNRRRRCSILIERGRTAVLVDTSPDLREQLLDAKVKHLDAVLFTHEHADQTHGIDDLRAMAYLMRRRIDVFMDERTGRILKNRFDYCFETPRGSSYPPILTAHEVVAGEAITIGRGSSEVVATAFEQDHGDIVSLGYRFGPIGYSSDVVDLDDKAFEILEGIDLWIVDSLRRSPHPTHAHVDKTLRWIERLNVPHAVLTNLHIELDYEALKASLPDHVEPAFDGMTLTLASS